MVGNLMIGCFFYKERITAVVKYINIQEEQVHSPGATPDERRANAP